MAAYFRLATQIKCYHLEAAEIVVNVPWQDSIVVNKASRKKKKKIITYTVVLHRQAIFNSFLN